MQTKVKYTARFPQSLYESLIWDSEKVTGYNVTLSSKILTQSMSSLSRAGLFWWAVLSHLLHWALQVAWPSLNANQAQIYHKIFRITFWAFDLRLGHQSKFSALTSLAETITKHAFPTFEVLKIHQMCTWVIFKDIENGRHPLHIYGVYNT